MYCRKCGQKLADGDRFCSACGARVENELSGLQETAEELGFVNHPEEDHIERPAPFSFSTEDLFSKKEPKKAAEEAPEPMAPVEDFDWNIHSFPGMKVEKTEDIDFQWDSDLLNDDSTVKMPQPEPTVADKLRQGIGDISVETPAVNPDFAEARDGKEDTAEGESLEKILFGGLDSKTDAAKKESEKIDKFFTFNQKNEEFQRLLDQEYEKIKSGNILEKELNEAEAASEEKFGAIQPEDPMEHLFETEGIVKGYQPKEIESDVLERIEAADLEKAAREKQLAAMQAEQEKAAAEGRDAGQAAAAEEISIAEVAEAMQDAEIPGSEDAADAAAEVPEPLNIQDIFKAAEADQAEDAGEDEAGEAESETEAPAAEIPQAEDADAFEEPEFMVMEAAETAAADMAEAAGESEAQQDTELQTAQPETLAEESAETEVQQDAGREPAAAPETEEIHRLSDEELSAEPTEENETAANFEAMEYTADAADAAGAVNLSGAEPQTAAEQAEPEADAETDEIPEPFAVGLMTDEAEKTAEGELPVFEAPKDTEPQAELLPEIEISDAAPAKAEPAQAEPAKDEKHAPQEISMEDFLAGELTGEKPMEFEFAPVDREAEAARRAAIEEERHQVTAAAEAAIAEAREKAAIARKELEEAAAKEEKMLRERYTSADHLSEMAKAREAFFTEDFGAEFKEEVRTGLFGSPRREAKEPAAAEISPAADYAADHIEEPKRTAQEEVPEILPAAKEPEPAAAEPLEEPAVFDGPVEIDFNQIEQPEPEADLGQTRAFDKEAILAGIAAATRIVSQDKIAEAQNELEQEQAADSMELPEVFDAFEPDLSTEESEEDAAAEPQTVTSDTLVMTEETLAEILEQANLEMPEDFAAEQEYEAEPAEEYETEPLQEEETPEVFFEPSEFQDTEEEPEFDFSDEYGEAEYAEPDVYEPGQEYVEPEQMREKAAEEERILQAAEEQFENGGQEAGEQGFDLTAEELKNENFDEYDEEKGGKGRIVLKVLLVILILLLALEIAGVVIKVTAPTSDAANLIDTQLNKVIQMVTGDETEYSVIAATEPVRTEASADKTEMIQKEINKNNHNNIQTIKYNAALAFDSSRTYTEGDLSLTQNLTDVFWYKTTENTPVYYDQSSVGAIIAFESQKMNLINNGDKGVLALVRKGTDFYKELEELAGSGPQTFRTLEIGEIREAGNAFYVWVSEEIDGDADGTADGTAANKVYMLEPEGKLMKVVNCYTV